MATLKRVMLKRPLIFLTTLFYNLCTNKYILLKYLRHNITFIMLCNKINKCVESGVRRKEKNLYEYSYMGTYTRTSKTLATRHC